MKVFFKANPAIMLGLIGSVLIIIGQIFAGDLTVAAAVPAITGAVTRFLVVPKPTE